MTTTFSEKRNKPYTNRIRDNRVPLGQFTPSHADLLGATHSSSFFGLFWFYVQIRKKKMYRKICHSLHTEICFSA